MGFILGLVVGGVEVVAAAGQAGLHDGEVLVRQCEIDHQFGLVVVQKGFQLFHVIGIHLCGLDVHVISGFVDGVHQFVALGLPAAGDHEVGEYIGVLRDLERGYGGHASSSYHQ